jgi:hypothetical protein
VAGLGAGQQQDGVAGVEHHRLGVRCAPEVDDGGVDGVAQAGDDGAQDRCGHRLRPGRPERTGPGRQHDGAAG